MEIADIIEKAGGPTKLGRLIDRSHSTVLSWSQVPAKHVPKVSEITKIPRHEIRPDLWEQPSLSAPEQEEAA
jgi:DNA-binding transcriptional regulator YdaS (Cro superfamily)